MADRKRIGILRADNHGLIYGAAWDIYDRYEFHLAHGQLYILEYTTPYMPVLPLRDTQVTGVWDYPLPEDQKDRVRLTANQFAKAFHCKVYDDYHDMADPALFDGVFIANCSFFAEDHLELAMPFIKAGVPVFLDKPIADNAKNCKEILDAAREYNTPVMGTSILMYTDANKEMLKENLGDPRLIVSTFASSITRRNASVHTLSACLGPLMTLKGDYEIVSMQYIGGGKGLMPAEEKPERDGGAWEVYRVRFKDDTVGILNCNTHNCYEFRMDVYGTNGISTKFVTEPTMRGAIADIAGQFAKMIDTRVPPLHYDRIFEFVAALDACDLSRAEGGREVSIKEIADSVGYELYRPMPAGKEEK
ncbi:MAG: Gfo/Idh/MocA family oxidoreductase [Ruminococcaceae bacterium]|nr:Gfo/Idh/MocA family oxidoreductase [Oscillospiraceae bacterium]